MRQQSLLPLVVAALTGPIAAQGDLPLCGDLRLKVLPEDPFSSDNFAMAVDVDGDTAVLGYHRDIVFGFDSGSVVFYRRMGDDWVFEDQVWPSVGAAQDNFGRVVAVDGGRALIGAPKNAFQIGSAYVFERNSNGAWIEVQELTIDGDAGDGFGASVALAGDLAVIGATGDDEAGGPGSFAQSGAAYVFERQGGKWAQTQKLLAFDGAEFDSFGDDVATDGTTIAVGASRGASPLHPEAGAAYTYRRNQLGSWVLDAKVTSPDAGTIGLGDPLAVDGNTLAVGAYLDAETINGGGAVHVFVRVGGGWVRQERLELEDPQLSDNFGFSLDLDGDRLVTGAIGVDADPLFNINTGCVHLFEREAGVWQRQPEMRSTDFTSHDQFGRSVALSGPHVVVGAPNHQSAGSANGAAYFLDLVSPFVPYAQGLAGSGGLVPAIAGTGCPAFGLESSIVITDGLGGAPGILLASASPATIPFLGGELLLAPPFLLVLPHVLGGALDVPGVGSFVQPSLINGPALSGLTFYLQSLYFDPGAPQSFSLTRGLAETVL